MKFLKILFAPVLESDKVSIGRTMLLVCFGLALWRWHGGLEILTTHQTILMCLIGYVLGTKGLGAAKDMLAKIRDTKTKLT